MVAHSWFRTLSGIDYASGFSAERILRIAYEIALNTVISGRTGRAAGADPRNHHRIASSAPTPSLEIVNRPPTRPNPFI